MNITYLQVTGRPSCGWKIIAVAAADAINMNVDFKQFAIAGDTYNAATNPLWSCMTFQYCAVKSCHLLT